jgi:outer membrane protein OmpA-like peptidoglycan-associated protein/tetratricopeptide (TPR) repeat protein
MRYFIFLFSFFILSFTAQGQSRKAIKYYNQAREKMAVNEAEDALEKANKALEESPEYTEARMLVAQLLIEQGEQEKAIQLYEGGLAYNPPYFFYYVYGTALYQTQLYARAIEALNTYITNPQASKKYISLSNTMLANSEFAMKAKAKPKSFTPENLGGLVNTDQLDYFPSISANGRTMIFTHRSLDGAKQDEDFWFSTRDADSLPWSKSAELKGYLNTNFNEGAQAISSNGKVIFFASCDKPNGFGSCDIYASFYKGKGVWGAPVNLGDSINSRFWESQPSISSDGRTLYFVRGSNSIAKNIDIYTSTLNANGRWSKAKRIKGAVNTSQQESSPFIHYDDEHLYFSSNGHPGMGDQDFFVSKREPDGSWGKPENLGYPINTSGEEFGLIVGPDGRTGYYSSDKGAVNYGLVDLYTFQLPKEVRAKPIAYIEGTVRNANTGEPLSAEILFTGINKVAKEYNTNSNRVGYYSSVLPVNEEYALSIQKTGYLFFSQNFDFIQDTSDQKVFTLNIDLIPIEVGERVKLENVFFDTDSYELNNKSTAELETMVSFLTRNQNVSVVIEGHTDSEGDKAYNKRLSQNRAKAVKDYLIAKGVEAIRLKAEGFGDSKPIADNSTDKGRKLNRRTEMRITSK